MIFDTVLALKIDAEKKKETIVIGLPNYTSWIVNNGPERLLADYEYEKKFEQVQLEGKQKYLERRRKAMTHETEPVIEITRDIGTLLEEASIGVPKIMVIEDASKHIRRIFLSSEQPCYDGLNQGSCIIYEDNTYFYRFIRTMKKAFKEGKFLEYFKLRYDLKYIDLKEGEEPREYDMFCLIPSSSNLYWAYCGIIFKEEYLKLAEYAYERVYNNELWMERRTHEKVSRIPIVGRLFDNYFEQKDSKIIEENLPEDLDESVDALFNCFSTYSLADALLNSSAHEHLFRDVYGSRRVQRYENMEKKYTGWVECKKNPLSALKVYEDILKENKLYTRLCVSCNSLVITGSQSLAVACPNKECKRIAINANKQYKEMKRFMEIPGEQERNNFLSAIRKKKNNYEKKYGFNDKIQNEFESISARVRDDRDKIGEDFGVVDYMEELQNLKRNFFDLVDSLH